MAHIIVVLINNWSREIEKYVFGLLSSNAIMLIINL